MSEGEIIDCNKNEKHKTVIILLFFTFAIDSKIKTLLQIKARNMMEKSLRTKQTIELKKVLQKRQNYIFSFFFLL